ncbi:MAG: FecCD family ABC transporter permease [Phycisphaerales bacterium JB063]
MTAQADSPGQGVARPTKRAVVGLSLIGLVLLASVGARLLVGSSGVGWPDGEHAGFIVQERSRMLLYAAVVGVALAVSGVALQALLRNALAEPYILGLSTGAGLGIALQTYIAAHFALYAGPRELAALVGAVLTLIIVFLASRRGGVIDRLGLLLTGVVLGTINGALIMLLHYLTPPEDQLDLMQWMMGLLPSRPLAWGDSAAIAVIVLGLGWLLWRAPAMDVATLDDDEAHALGVHGPRLRLGLLVTASALAAAGVVVAGPIAFVGLICPHLARLILGPAHRGALLGSAMLGASLLVSANVAAELIAHLHPTTGRLPVGIFTALVGGPAFLWMLRPKLGAGVSEG